MEEKKKFMKLALIPSIMIVLSIVIALIANDDIRKIFIGIQFALLAVHTLICIDYIEKLKKGE